MKRFQPGPMKAGSFPATDVPNRTRSARIFRRFAVSALALLLTTACADQTPTGVGPASSVDPGSAPASNAFLQQDGEYVPGRVLARFQPGAPAASIAASQGATLQREVALGIQMLSVEPGRESQVAQALSNNPNVEFAEPDYIRTFGDPSAMPVNDPYIGYKWDLDNDGSIYSSTGSVLANTGRADADMDWKEAYEYLGGSVPGSAVIGIIDSGIREDHVELAGRVLAQYDFWDDDAIAADDDGHGTHVAGIAGGATNNAAGVAGVSFANTQFVIAKACGPVFFGPVQLSYGCSASAIASGITWAVDHGANVLNLSLGGSTGSASEQAALQYARSHDVLPFCAAGNDGGAVSYPAAFPECVAVSATDWGDNLASYSNFGPEVELSAPGGDLEDSNGYSYILSSYNESSTSYAFLAGTSMASPQAAGLAALLHALGTTDDDAKLALMESSADDLGPTGRDDKFGAGRINAFNAVTGSSGGGPPPNNNPPVASFDHACAGLTCDFTDTSSDDDGLIVEWNWDFGDGSTSTEQNPTHVYDAEGTFAVTLVVADDDGATDEAALSMTVTSTSGTIVAQFSVQCDSLTCQFTNESYDDAGNTLLADWDYGDGSAIEVAWSPTHTYAQAGTYDVMLLVAEPDFSAWETTTQSVTVPAQSEPPPNPVGPTAAFTVDCTYLVCSFTDASTPGDGSITSWSWTFGDGASDSNQDPSHTYASDGSYTVSLTVMDDNGLSDASTQTVTVAAEPPPTPVISLSASGHKVKGRHNIDLTWSGATTNTVAIVRDGASIGNQPNDPSGPNTWTDATGNRGSATYVYQVCEADGGGQATSVCSSEVTVQF